MQFNEFNVKLTDLPNDAITHIFSFLLPPFSHLSIRALRSCQSACSFALSSQRLLRIARKIYGSSLISIVDPYYVLKPYFLPANFNPRQYLDTSLHLRCIPLIAHHALRELHLPPITKSATFTSLLQLIAVNCTSLHTLSFYDIIDDGDELGQTLPYPQLLSVKNVSVLFPTKRFFERTISFFPCMEALSFHHVYADNIPLIEDCFSRNEHTKTITSILVSIIESLASQQASASSTTDAEINQRKRELDNRARSNFNSFWKYTQSAVIQLNFPNLKQLKIRVPQLLISSTPSLQNILYLHRTGEKQSTRSYSTVIEIESPDIWYNDQCIIASNSTNARNISTATSNLIYPIRFHAGTGIPIHGVDTIICNRHNRINRGPSVLPFLLQHASIIYMPECCIQIYADDGDSAGEMKQSMKVAYQEKCTAHTLEILHRSCGSNLSFAVDVVQWCPSIKHLRVSMHILARHDSGLPLTRLCTQQVESLHFMDEYNGRKKVSAEEFINMCATFRYLTSFLTKDCSPLKFVFFDHLHISRHSEQQKLNTQQVLQMNNALSEITQMEKDLPDLDVCSLKDLILDFLGQHT